MSFQRQSQILVLKVDTCPVCRGKLWYEEEYCVIRCRCAACTVEELIEKLGSEVRLGVETRRRIAARAELLLDRVWPRSSGVYPVALVAAALFKAARQLKRSGTIPSSLQLVYIRASARITKDQFNSAFRRFDASWSQLEESGFSRC